MSRLPFESNHTSCKEAKIVLSTPYSTGAALLSLASLSDAREAGINLVIHMSAETPLPLMSTCYVLLE